MANQTQIQETTKILSSILAIPEKNLGKILNYHARKVPVQDREDIVQDLAEKLLATKPANAKLTFVICKNRVNDWWRHYKASKGYESFSLYDTLENTENITLEETLSAEYQYAKRLDSDIDAENLLAKLPANIQNIISKRLLGVGSTATERQTLHRFIASNPAILC